MFVLCLTIFYYVISYYIIMYSLILCYIILHIFQPALSSLQRLLRRSSPAELDASRGVDSLTRPSVTPYEGLVF